jgi:hypothetical protein
MFDPAKLREKAIENLTMRLGEAMNRAIVQQLDMLKSNPNKAITFQMSDRNCVHQFTFTLEFVPAANGERLEEEYVNVHGQLLHHQRG